MEPILHHWVIYLVAAQQPMQEPSS